MRRKLLSVLMAFVLVAMLPTASVFADEPTTEPDPVEATTAPAPDEQAADLDSTDPASEPGFEDPAVDPGSVEATSYETLAEPSIVWGTDSVTIQFDSADVATVEIYYRGKGYFTPPYFAVLIDGVPQTDWAVQPGVYVKKEGKSVVNVSDFPSGIITVVPHFSATVEAEVVLLGAPVNGVAPEILRQPGTVVGYAPLPNLSAPCTISDPISGRWGLAQVIDIPESSKQSGVQAILFKDQQTANQRFRFDLDPEDGYYTITNINSGLVLDVSGGSSAVDGSSVIQFAAHGGDNQKWSIVYDDGHYAFVSKLSESLDDPLMLSFEDITGGADFPGPGLCVYNNYGISFLFDINPQEQVPSLSYPRYYICSEAGGVILDVAEGSLEPGAPLIAFWSHGGTNQKFDLVYDAPTGYYRIINVKSGLPLDVFGSLTQKGTPIIQWTPNGAFNQLWSITPAIGGSYLITSASSGLVLDISGGAGINGAKIITWPMHGGPNQRWWLSPVSVP